MATGRQDSADEYAEEIVGLDADLVPHYGYDGHIRLYSDDIDERGLSSAECIALADMMLKRWQAFRDKHTIADAGLPLQLGSSAGLGGWRPISSAPLDGTSVDLWVAGPRNVEGTRQTDCWFENGQWWQEFGREGPTQPGSMVGDVPVYWMPQPGPPNAQTTGS